MVERRVAILGSLLLLVTCPAFAQVFSGSVVDVEDGDTFTVLRDSVLVTVQLHGIDAPEPEQPFGPRATAFVRRQIEGERVRVQIRNRDRFGRAVASVIHDGSELNEQVLQAGLAWYHWSYDEYTSDAARDQRLEYRAQQARRGLWRQSTPIPPWDWRDWDRGAAYATGGPTDLQYNPSGVPRDCDDFATQEAAQRFLDTALPRVAGGLDRDGDGVACEGTFGR